MADATPKNVLAEIRRNVIVNITTNRALSDAQVPRRTCSARSAVCCRGPGRVTQRDNCPSCPGKTCIRAKGPLSGGCPMGHSAFPQVALWRVPGECPNWRSPAVMDTPRRLRAPLERIFPYVRLSAVARGGAAFSVTVRSEIGGRGRGKRAPHYARLRRALFPVLFRHCTCPSCWDNSNTCPIRTQEFS